MLWCPRLDHFVRFNPNGTVSKCGHMIDAPMFDSLSEMQSSDWLHDVKQKMVENTWPSECERCKEIEQAGGQSVRSDAVRLHDKSTLVDYLQVGGVLDNICNSACQFCSAHCSTKIGSLQSRFFERIDNYSKFLQLPLDRIEHLDINGGEPSYSKNYKHLIKNLPPNLRSLRVNTNCATVIHELEDINRSGVEVTVTVSFDGIGNVHDYVRWPVKWQAFYENLMQYKQFNLADLNLWSTVNALNVCDLPNIWQFVKEHDLHHAYALLHSPEPLSVRFSNNLTRSAKNILQSSRDTELNQLAELIAIDRDNSLELKSFVNRQDMLRKIKITDYINVIL